MRDYARTWNDTGLLVLQIETAKGLAAAPDIAALEGVDMLFFGPSDYAADQNLDPVKDSDEILAACRRMIAAAHDAGKLAGSFFWPGGDPARLIGPGSGGGADLVAVGSDVRGLAQSFTAALAACPLAR